MSQSVLHETDFHAWTIEQAALIRAGRLEAADLANIAEEIESLGRSERREMINRLIILLAHLLKWQYQPALRGNSWRLTIVEQRGRLIEHLGDNPSLAPQLPEAIDRAYRFAVITAERETGQSGFPAACPYGQAEILDEAYLPAWDASGPVQNS